jgi:hypothetical protein
MAFDPTKRKPPTPKETPRRSKYSVPTGEQDPVPPASAPANSKRTPAKRGNPDYSQVSAQIPKDLHKRFKAKVALEEDDDLTTVLERLIRDYVGDE